MDSLADGKADGSYSELERIAALRVANELTFAQLDKDVALSSRAATNIVAHRDGVDHVHGTADDDPFDTIAELDAVPYVGPVAFAHLVAYAHERGWVPALPPLVKTGAPASSSFGNGIALAGDTLVVGAPSAGYLDHGADGQVTVYTRGASGWTSPIVIDAPWHTSDLAHGFGGAIALDGDTLVVGGHYRDVRQTQAPDQVRTANNPVTVFERSSGGWTQTKTFDASVAKASFGTSVAIAHDLIAIGAPSEASGAACAGAVHVYARSESGWVEKATLESPAGHTCLGDDDFGASLALADGTLVVGSPRERDTGGTPTGAVYVYDTSALGSAPARLQPSNLGPLGLDHPSGYFGQSLSLDADNLAITADGYAAAFIYKRTGSSWALANRIDPPIAALGAGVGISSISIEGDLVLIGAFALANYTRAGAFLYAKSSPDWVLVAKAHAPDSFTGYFGASVLLRDEHVVIAAPGFVEPFPLPNVSLGGTVFTD